MTTAATLHRPAQHLLVRPGVAVGVRSVEQVLKSCVTAPKAALLGLKSLPYDSRRTCRTAISALIPAPTASTVSSAGAPLLVAASTP